jgi:sarcosine oxidase
MHGDRAEDWFYGFPTLPGATGVKLASETFADPQASPDAIRREIEPDEAEALYRRHVEGRLPGIRPVYRQAATCLYTTTPDHHFLIDRHPESERILLVSACSGHGFKHSAAISEAAAELAITGRSALDLSPFGLARLGGVHPAA